MAKNDPVAFAERRLKVQVWPLQAAILRAITESRRVAVRSCHSSGKTFLAAVLAVYWLLRWSDAKVNHYWPILHPNSHGLIRPNSCLATSNADHADARFRCRCKLNRELNPSNFILGISTDSAERISGFHSNHVLVIIDEASGVDAKIWEAVESLLASGDARLLAIGNPLATGNEFHQAFTRNVRDWQTFSIGWKDTPNFARIESIEQLLSMDEAELQRNRLDGLERTGRIFDAD